MNRRVDIDLEVQWPPARTSERWPSSQEGASDYEPSGALSDQYSSGAKGLTQDDLKTYGSGELFDGAKEVGIRHAGSVYRLKITRQGKLILNK
ncbi:hemin uptake protein HemP [Brucellaceae bacterium C25G]